jgi:hypothetical protein
MPTATVMAPACPNSNAFPAKRAACRPFGCMGLFCMFVISGSGQAAQQRATGGTSTKMRKYRERRCWECMPRILRNPSGVFFRTCAAPPARRFRKNWWSRSGSNRRPQRCERCALPTELRPHSAHRRSISLSVGGRIMVSGPFPVKRSERVLKRFPDTLRACTRIARSLGSAKHFARRTNHGKHHECRRKSGR